MQRTTTQSPNPRLVPVKWRAWPGLAGPSSLEGAISGVGLTEVDAARVVIEGAGIRHVLPVRGGRFTVDGLTPGAYRVEVRLERLIIARRLEVPVGHHFVSFAVRLPPVRRAA